jgi:hypothetical protein
MRFYKRYIFYKAVVKINFDISQNFLLQLYFVIEYTKYIFNYKTVASYRSYFRQSLFL